MNQKTKLLIFLFLFIVIIAGATVGYKILNYKKEIPQNTYTNTSTGRPNNVNVTTESNVVDTIKTEDITLYDKNGNAVKLSDFIGKPIVINIWSITCIYCIEEMEYFERATQKYDDVEILMVTPTYGKESNKKVSKEFVEENKYSFDIYFDDENKVMKKYKATGFPTTVFIDKTGNTVKTHIGLIDENILENYIKEIR